MSVSLALQRWKQEELKFKVNLKFKVILSYVVGSPV